MANRPRQFTPEFKSQMVLELLTQQRTAGEICRVHQIKDSLLYRWKQEFLERAPSVFATGDHGEVSRLSQRVAELERMVGRPSMAAHGQPRENPYAERVIRTIKEE